MNRRDDLVFSMSEFERRLNLVRQELAHRELDAMIVTTPENMYYLTGYYTPGFYYFQALVVPVEQEPFMVVRLLEESNIHAGTWVEHSRAYADTESPVALLRFSLSEFGLDRGRIGYEKHSYFFRATEQEQLMASARDVNFVDCSGLVEQFRLVKSEEELAKIRRAAVSTEAGVRAGLAAAQEGATENDVAAAVLEALTRTGSRRVAMGPFIATGARGAIGHAEYENTALRGGEVVFMEVGACYDHYHAAMMRPVCLGEPSLAVTEAERVVREAMQVSLDMIRPGIAAGDVDAQNRYILDRYAHGGRQSTRSGYSIGIGISPYWGEGHTFSIEPGERRYFEENMTFHLIPWMQVPGQFGLGLSETIRVTADGCEPLLDVERKLVVK